jgi:hypothetical protein
LFDVSFAMKTKFHYKKFIYDKIKGFNYHIHKNKIYTFN